MLLAWLFGIRRQFNGTKKSTEITLFLVALVLMFHNV
jgi:hypothetical protein